MPGGLQKLPLAAMGRATGALIVAASAVHCAPGFAYEGDHYVMTYYLALKLGYTQRQAYQLASGAYALDWDANTSPMEASVGDAILGANTGLSSRNLPLQFGRQHAVMAAIMGFGNWDKAGHPGMYPTKNGRLANTWKDFHAFADEDLLPLPSLIGSFVKKAFAIEHDQNMFMGCSLTTTEEAVAQAYFLQVNYDSAPPPPCSQQVRDAVEAQRSARKDQLWVLATNDHNPGPLIHYVQDYQSHFLFNNTRGHAIAGHAPDFLSFNPARAKAAADETVQKLADFRGLIRNFADKTEGDLLPQNPQDPTDAEVAKVVAELVEANPKPDVRDKRLFDPDGPNRLIPNLGNAEAVVNDYLFLNYTKRWPADLTDADLSIPKHWFNYRYSPQGRFQDEASSAVETVSLHFDAVIKKISEIKDQVQIYIRLPYTISGLAPIGDYLYPLPVIEQHEFTGRPQKRFAVSYSKSDGVGAFQDYESTPAERRPKAGDASFAVVTGAGWFDPAAFPIEPLTARLRRGNGEHYMEAVVVLDKDDYYSGRIRWQPSVWLYGYEVKKGAVVILSPSVCGDLTSTKWLSPASPNMGNHWLFQAGKPGEPVTLIWYQDVQPSSNIYTFSGSYNEQTRKLSLTRTMEDGGTETDELTISEGCDSITGTASLAAKTRGAYQQDFSLSRDSGQ